MFDNLRIHRKFLQNNALIMEMIQFRWGGDSSGIISSITLQGDSYDTGVTIGSWEPNYSWTEISTNKRYCQIYMKGTVNYLWEGLNLSMDATFKATGKGNGSKIEEAYTGDWPG